MEPEIKVNGCDDNFELTTCFSIVEALERGNIKAVEDALSKRDVDLFQVNKVMKYNLNVQIYVPKFLRSSVSLAG